MKNKKGFTLVELLAVIVVLAIIISIISVSSAAISKRSKNKAYENKKKIIVKAAEIYSDDHPTLASSNTDCSITIQDLIDNGYLKKDEGNAVIDPRDNTSMNDMHICVEKSGKKTVITLQDEDDNYSSGKTIKQRIIEAANEYIAKYPNKKGTCITLDELKSGSSLDSSITGNYKICFDEDGNVTVTKIEGSSSTITCSIVVSNKNEWKPLKDLTGRVNNAGNASLSYSWDGNSYSNTLTTKRVTENGTYTLFVKVNNSSVITCNTQVTKIDANEPIIKIIANSDNEYTKEKNVQAIEIQDIDSGISSANIEYGFSTSNTIEPTTYRKATANFTSGTTSPLKLQVINDAKNLDGDYYLWVKAIDLKDKALNSYSGGNIISTGTFKFDNTPPSCLINYKNNDKNTWKSSKILVPQTSTDNYSGDVQYSWDNDTWSRTPSEKTITENGTYKLYVKDKAGNKANCNVVEEKIDTAAPTININIENSDIPTKAKRVTVTIKDINSTLDLANSSIGIAIVKKGEEPKASDIVTEGLDTSGSATEQVKIKDYNNLTGEYYIYVDARNIKDIARNSATTYETDSFILDNTGPTCTISGAPSGGAQGAMLEITDVVDTYSEIDGYSWDGSTYGQAATNYVTENGTYTGYVKDKLGNVGSCSIALNAMIDTTIPTVEISKQSDTTYSQTKSVTVTIKDADSGLAENQEVYYGLSYNSEDEPDELDKIEFENASGAKQASKEIILGGDNLTGEYYLWIIANIEDTAGNFLQNYQLISTGMFYFDNDAPVIDIEADNYDVTKSKNVTIRIYDEKTNTVSINGLQYGLSTSDEIEPTYYNASGAITDIDGAIIYNLNLNANLTGEYYLWVKANNLKDSIGNMVTEPTISDSLIFDNQIPDCSISGIPTNWVQSTTLIASAEDNVAGLAEEPYSWDGINYSNNPNLAITANGTYTVYVKDAVNNVATCSATVSKIDTSAPDNVTLEITENGANSVNLKITGKDDQSDISKFVIYYGTSSSSLTSTKELISSEYLKINGKVTGGNTTIDNLTAGQTYYFKVEAFNGLNMKTSTNIISGKLNTYYYYRTSSSVGTTPVYRTDILYQTYYQTYYRTYVYEIITSLKLNYQVNGRQGEIGFPLNMGVNTKVVTFVPNLGNTYSFYQNSTLRSINANVTNVSYRVTNVQPGNFNNSCIIQNYIIGGRSQSTAYQSTSQSSTSQRSTGQNLVSIGNNVVYTTYNTSDLNTSVSGRAYTSTRYTFEP